MATLRAFGRRGGFILFALAFGMLAPEARGQEKKVRKPATLLVHGLTRSLNAPAAGWGEARTDAAGKVRWDGLIGFLQAEGYRFGGVIRPKTKNLTLPDVLDAGHAPGDPAAADFYSLEFSARAKEGGMDPMADELAKCIQELCKYTGCEKVRLVTHSAGGLAARAYLQGALHSCEYRGDVDRLITISCPHLGAYLATGLGDLLGTRADQLRHNSTNILELNDKLDLPTGVKYASIVVRGFGSGMETGQGEAYYPLIGRGRLDSLPEDYRVGGDGIVHVLSQNMRLAACAKRYEERTSHAIQSVVLPYANSRLSTHTQCLYDYGVHLWVAKFLENDEGCWTGDWRPVSQRFRWVDLQAEFFAWRVAWKSYQRHFATRVSPEWQFVQFRDAEKDQWHYRFLCQGRWDGGVDQVSGNVTLSSDRFGRIINVSSQLTTQLSIYDKDRPDESTPSGLLQGGIHQLETGNFILASDKFRSVLKSEPGNLEAKSRLQAALRLVGELECRRRDYNSAAMLFSVANDVTYRDSLQGMAIYCRPETDTVATLNVKQLRSCELFKQLNIRDILQPSSMPAEAQQFLKAAGLTGLDKIDRATVFGQAPFDNQALFIIEGRFDSARAQALLKENKDVVTHSIQNHKFPYFQQGSAYLAISSDKIFLSSDSEQIALALNAMLGKRRPVQTNNPGLALLGAIDPKKSFSCVFAAHDNSAFVSPKMFHAHAHLTDGLHAEAFIINNYQPKAEDLAKIESIPDNVDYWPEQPAKAQLTAQRLHNSIKVSMVLGSDELTSLFHEEVRPALEILSDEERDKRRSESKAALARGKLDMSRGDGESAIKHFTGAIRTDPSNADAFYFRGRVHLSLFKHKPALRDFTKAIRRDGGHEQAYCERGRTYVTLGETDLAIADCKEALRLNAKNCDAMYTLIPIYFYTTKDYKAAIELCDKRIGIFGADHFSYSYRGASYHELGDYGRAIDDLSEAIRIAPDSLDYEYRARAHAANGNFQQAEQDRERAKKAR